VVTLVVFAAKSKGLSTPVDAMPQWFSSTLPGWPIGVRVAAGAAGAAAAIAVTFLIHELGHLVTGLCLGFRFHAIRIGRVQLNYPFRFSWVRPVGRGAAAMVSMFPVGFARLRPRALGMLAAGPAANLVTALAIALLPFDKGWFSGLLGLCSGCIGAINLIPFQRGTFKSDGCRIVTLVRHPQEGRRWLAILALNAELADGVAPESLSPHFLSAAAAVGDDSFDTLAGHLLVYLNRFYRRDDAGAADALETCLEQAGRMPEPIRESLICEAAVFQGRRRGRADLAELWLADIPPEPTFPGIRLQAEAAILEARGDRAGARQLVEQVEALVADRANLPARELSLRLLQRWRNELNER
jgi:hypothetical protein